MFKKYRHKESGEVVEAFFLIIVYEVKRKVGKLYHYKKINYKIFEQQYEPIE